MKAIYFADTAGDLQEELKTIKCILRRHNLDFNIKATDLPPWDEKFDILFFDWGGMSAGNSMLDHFCRWIIDHAEEHPGNVYVMTSVFTEAAMKDAINEMPVRPNNIYLKLDDKNTIMALSVFR